MDPRQPDFGGSEGHAAFPAARPAFGHAAERGSGRGGGAAVRAGPPLSGGQRSEAHTSELQSLMRISYAVFCLNKENVVRHNFYNRIPELTLIIHTTKAYTNDVKHTHTT